MTIHRERGGDDRGVVLILVAVAMVAILIIAAMALDLGAKRANVRADQSVADLASLAAGSFLAGNGQATAISNPFAACQAAVTSARTNVPAFAPTQDPATECATFTANASTGCTAVSPPHEAVFSDTRYTLTIRYPIPDAELVDARFAGGAGENDGTNRCERMKISFQQISPTTFARVIGSNQQVSRASSVVRANTKQISEGVAALLLLERVGCGSLQTSGGGSGGDGVIVQAPPVPPAKANNPGVIQADSAGVVGSNAANPLFPCGPGSSGNPGNYVLFGTALPGGNPSVDAQPAVDGTPGIIGLFSLSVGGKGGYQFPGGISVAPTTAQISSRQPADSKYNKAVADDGAAQISTLHATGYSRSNNDPLLSDAVISTNPECGGTISPLKLAATVVYVDCRTFQPALNVFPNATTFVVRGNINIKNGSALVLPVARHVYIRGCHSPTGPNCSGPVGPDAITVVNGGALLVNTGETVVPPSGSGANFGGGTACSSRKGPGAGGTTSNFTELATFSGKVSIAGLARLCQTTVYLGKDASSYVRQAVESTGSGPENYPAIAGCDASLPCPKMSGYDASIQVNGATDWSAPNQLNRAWTVADAPAYPLEDLALWSESDSTSALKGQGLNVTEGVYFLPNANATFTGLGAQPIALNAQYFIRTLNVASQGTLRLRPSPADSIPTPIPGGLALIR